MPVLPLVGSRSEERRVGKECLECRVDLGGRRIIQAEDGIRDSTLGDWSSDVCSSDLCDAHAGLVPQDVLQMLGNSARRASASLGVTLGRLDVGAAADVVITDCVPFTALTADNLAAHVIFAMGSQQVRHVLIDGKWVLRDRTVIGCDEAAVRHKSGPIAENLWQRMSQF